MVANNVEVEIGDSTSGNGAKTAVITDKAANRAWSGEGKTAGEAATEATRKFLGDRRAREYVGGS